MLAGLAHASKNPAAGPEQSHCVGVGPSTLRSIRPNRKPEMVPSVLSHNRILVVEDEYFIAMSLKEWLENEGYVVLGPVPSVEKAVNLIEAETDIDGAVLDVNLGGAFAYPVADRLLVRDIPFVFTSGYEDGVLRSRYPQIRICQKPYIPADVEEALENAMSA
jgi:CheY-like chemotaxis protein